MSYLNSIVFFQYFHNGDLFSSKEYVRQITQEVKNVNFEYYHFNHEKVLKDLNIPLTQLPSALGKNGKGMPVLFQNNNTLFINTWIEAFKKNQISLPIESIHGINHYRLRAQWKYIFDILNISYKSDLQLKPIDEYVADIDFSVFNTEKIKNPSTKKKILFSNGEVKSNQSFSGNMENVIIQLAKKFKDWEFYCTSRFNSVESNICFTDDVIPDDYNHAPSRVDWSRSKCDLNEISYFSQFCDIIVGRNSGPFIFCLTKNNVFDPNKTFITFNKFHDDSLLRDINHKCEYVWSNQYSLENILHIIESAILSKK
jgi:hypothetical protein